MEKDTLKRTRALQVYQQSVNTKDLQKAKKRYFNALGKQYAISKCFKDISLMFSNSEALKVNHYLDSSWDSHFTSKQIRKHLIKNMKEFDTNYYIYCKNHEKYSKDGLDMFKPSEVNISHLTYRMVQRVYNDSKIKTYQARNVFLDNLVKNNTTLTELIGKIKKAHSVSDIIDIVNHIVLIDDNLVSHLKALIHSMLKHNDTNTLQDIIDTTVVTIYAHVSNEYNNYIDMIS